MSLRFCKQRSMKTCEEAEVELQALLTLATTGREKLDGLRIRSFYFLEIGVSVPIIVSPRRRGYPARSLVTLY